MLLSSLLAGLTGVSDMESVVRYSWWLTMVMVGISIIRFFYLENRICIETKVGQRIKYQKIFWRYLFGEITLDDQPTLIRVLAPKQKNIIRFICLWVLGEFLLILLVGVIGILNG
jgi:hypothetical protein